MMSRSPKAHSKMLEEKIKSIFFYNFVLKANMIAQTNKNKQCSKGLKKNCFNFLFSWWNGTIISWWFLAQTLRCGTAEPQLWPNFVLFVGFLWVLSSCKDSLNIFDSTEMPMSYLMSRVVKSKSAISPLKMQVLKWTERCAVSAWLSKCYISIFTNISNSFICEKQCVRLV